MARQKMRDWPVMVYSYWVQPDGKEPQAVWDEAKRMNKLWNFLVEHGQKQRDKYQELFSSNTGIAAIQEELEAARVKYQEADEALMNARKKFRTKSGKELSSYIHDKKLAADTKKEIFQRLKIAKADFKGSDAWQQTEEARAKLKEEGQELSRLAYREFRKEGCHYDNIGSVMDNYRHALSRAFKTKDWPKFHGFGGRDFSFVHRYREGGAPVEKIFKGTSFFVIDPVPDNAYDDSIKQRERKRLARTKVRFLIGGEMVQFRTILHRPLPEGAIVKQVRIVRRQSTTRADWSLAITVEVPQEGMPRIPVSDRIEACAIDLGWRVMDDNVRIGVLVDTKGKVEPLFLPTKLLPDKDEKHDIHNTSFVGINKYIIELQKGLDDELNRIKEVTKKAVAVILEKLPEDRRDVLNAWDKARANRLFKIINVLKENSLDKDLLEALQSWKHHHLKTQDRINGTRARMLKHRRHFYKNLSLRLCKEYDKIIVEKLDLSELARKEKEDGSVSPLPQKAGDYRKLAALSEFTGALKMMSAKTGAVIEQGNAVFSTRECNECGYINESPEHPEKLEWICSGCQARWDQDENASRNLLKRRV